MTQSKVLAVAVSDVTAGERFLLLFLLISLYISLSVASNQTEQHKTFFNTALRPDTDVLVAADGGRTSYFGVEIPPPMSLSFFTSGFVSPFLYFTLWDFSGDGRRYI